MEATKISGAFIPFAKEIEGCIFAGRYVCESCHQSVVGLLLKNGRWDCEACQSGKVRKVRQVTPEQRQVMVERLALARQARQKAQEIVTIVV
jgi:hypothetical protein